MDTLKKYAGYILLLAVFWIFSNFLIYVGINSTYKELDRLDNVQQIKVFQAESTVVNGRIKAVVTNEGSENISGKYVKLDLYSERNTHMGTKYVEIGELKQGEVKTLEYNYKASRTTSYKFSIVNEKEDLGQQEMDTNIKMSTTEILVLTGLVMLMIM